MTIFHLPDLGEGLAEAEIREWLVKEGDVVKVDQPMVSMETAKAVVEVPSPHAGKIIKLYGKAGDIIQTDGPLVEFEGEKTEVKKDKGTVVGSLEESSTVMDHGDMIIGSAKQASATSVKAMPAIRALAKQLNVDLNSVTPTGPRGQITAEDVKKLAGQTHKPAFAKENSTVKQLHGVRRAMAIAMTQSHQEVVPVSIVDDADITHFSPKTDITIRIIHAIVAGVKAEPCINSWYDGKAMELCTLKEINLGLAVDTEEGLFVPVLKDVANKTAEELRNQINIFKKQARDRTLPPSDLHGATITLSNFGMIAGRYANPIVVPPSIAIIGCGRIREEVVARTDKIEIRRMMPLSLTFDHRAMTGGEATRFLGAMMKSLEEKK